MSIIKFINTILGWSCAINGFNYLIQRDLELAEVYLAIVWFSGLLGFLLQDYEESA